MYTFGNIYVGLLNLIYCMKLSIIIPMYNAERYIGGCLDSLLNQDLSVEEYEIIVINDGSTDNGEQIVQTYIKKYPQILLYSQENGGVSNARNKGMSLARGEYVCFVDADDFLIENALGRIVEEALKRNLQILVYQKTEEKESHDSTFQVEEAQTGIKFIEKHNFVNYVWNCVIQKSFLSDNDLRFVDGRFCEDIMFNLNAYLHADRMAAIDAKVYCYIVRPNSIMTNTNSVHLMKMMDDFQYVIDYINALIMKYKSVMTAGCYNRCISRRNSYIFFLLIRMLRAKVDKEYVDKVVNELKKKGLYPYQRMSKIEYKGGKYTYIHYITNHPVLYKTACVLYKIWK